MNKEELQKENAELKSKLFDLERDLFEQKMFVEIADERIEKAYKKVDELLTYKCIRTCPLRKKRKN